MTFELTVLGSSSATPAFQRNPASQVLNIHDKLFLIDCGEATQIQLVRYKVKYQRINHIFISHLHGDHYLGLMGLLSTLHLQGRTSPMTIYCHAPLAEIIRLELEVSGTALRFPIEFKFLPDEETCIYDDGNIMVETIRLNHRIPCMGFLFREKKTYFKVRKEMIEAHSIPVEAIAGIKEGNDFTDAVGNVIPNREITYPPRNPRSFAYCSDTLFDAHVEKKVNGVTMLYHEATFLHDLLDRAVETFHTTALQAGKLAKNAGVEKLLIGHFSARYRELELFLKEARTEFPNTYLAVEGEKIRVDSLNDPFPSP